MAAMWPGRFFRLPQGRGGMVRITIGSALAMCAACGGGSSSAPTAPTTPSAPANATSFRGTIAGTGSQSGTVDITIQTTVPSSSFRFPFRLIEIVHAQGAVGATGTVRVAGGAPTSVTGGFDSSTNAVTLAGGQFALTGTVRGGVLSGTYTAAGGGSGGFSTLNSTNTPVTVFCGTWTSESGASGIWNLQTSGAGLLSGVSVPDLVFLTGQVTGNTLMITTSEGGTGTGTIQGNSVSGTGRSGGTGEHRISFSGSTGRCQ